jgi:RNA polymerase sigma-70 factor (ECF subfamily)
VVSLEQIIRECKQFNKLAQKMLYDMYSPAMKGICLRYIGDAEVAKDLLQEGFIKVFYHIKQYSGNGSFEGWMKRIFINTAISYLRKQQKTQNYLKIDEIVETSFSDLTTDPIETRTKFDKNELISNQNNYELVSLADFSEQELLNVLEKLPEKYRIVFNLYCIEEIKHEEIAEALKIDAATSRTRLLRARQIIQKELFDMSITRLSEKFDE